MSTKKTLVISSQFGAFSILLFDDRAPTTCDYFSTLACNGAFDDCCVFRIASESNQQPDDSCPIHVVQIGPIENIASDRHPIAHEGTNLTGLFHEKWTVSAARFDLGELYGSFFICMRDEPELDYGGSRQSDGQGFAAFGQVIEGFESLERIYQNAESDEMLTKQVPILGVSLKENSLNTEAGCQNGE